MMLSGRLSLSRVLLNVLCILYLPFCASAQTPLNLTGSWTGERVETGSFGSLPANSNQVLILYQTTSGGPVVGLLSTFWPGTPYYWSAYASGTLSGDALNLTWTVIPATVVLPAGNTACSVTNATLALSTRGSVTTATIPSYHPCGDASATIEQYTLTLVGWQKMLGMDNSGGTGCTPLCGDPIDAATGNVYESITDYQTSGSNKLSLTRYYNSFTPPLPAATSIALINVPHWTTNYDRWLVVNSAGTQIIAHRPDGEQLTFNLTGGAWLPDTDVDMTLASSGNTWTLTLHDDTRETYTLTIPIGLAGTAQLDAITARDGYTQTMAYDASGQLSSVTDSYGRALTFAYVNGLLTQVATPDSLVLTYGYDSSGINPGVDDRLASVSYNTSPVTSQSYNYAAPSPFNLTSVIDEDGNAYTSFTYDNYGRGLTSQHAGGAGLTTVTYNDTAGTRTVTNALGEQETYTFVSLQGANKTIQISRSAHSPVVAATRKFTYDSNGYMASATDWNGNRTTYVNDTHGDPTAVNEAVGTPVARTTTILYDSTCVHLPGTIITTGLTTSFTYDSNCDALTRTNSDTTTQTVPYSTSGQTRTWTYTWSDFLLASAQSPNGNTTKYSYDSSGALIRITNPLSQATRITSHTGGGYPLIIVDPDKVTTTLTYNARIWRLTSTVSAASQPSFTTNWTYDPAGNLTQVTLPDNSFLAYTYDAAHRIVQVADTLGNYVSYTLDALGDKTQINTYGSTATLERQHSATFDVLGRILTDIGGVGQTTTYSYDSNGNTLTVIDPLNHKTTRTFDALNRLSTSTDPNSGVTRFTYDSHDRVLTVTDPNNNVTSHVYDGFGDAIQQVSPDSGKTIYHFDTDANLTTKTDALLIVTNDSYDALDRLMTTTYPADPAENVAYTYDQTGAGFGFGIGRLTSLTDAAGSLSRAWDERGNMLSEKRIGGGTTLTTRYTYDPASRISSITYPDGAIMANQYDAAGYLKHVLVRPPGASAYSSVASLTHLPFGPINSASYGNRIAEAWTFDLDYRATNLADTLKAANVQNLTYTYDADNNVKAIADAVNGANSQTLGYDVLNRLTSAASGTGGYGTYGWTYDKLGNRLTQTAGSAKTTYTYTPGNRLATITAGGVKTTVVTNANGNITGIPPANSTALATFAYNNANRMASVTGTALAAAYVYDAFGRRFSKTDSGSPSILYTFAQDGSLLEENDNGAITDYLYANGRPISILQPGVSPTANQVNYVLADRLGTPQLVANGSAATVWSTTYQPFGTTAIPTASITQNLRFPGQNFDGETGFNYNLNRDYMPNLGRYLETDSIGLAGGVNTYTYASENSLRNIDPTGRCWWLLGELGAFLADESGVSAGLDASYNWLFSTTGLTGTAAVLSQNSQVEQEFDQSAQEFEEAYAEYYGASNSANAVGLNMSLASEQQMGELGEPFAGAGTSVPLNDVNRLVSEYGGSVNDWAKMTSSNYTSSNGFYFETHWYENLETGQQVEFKIKLPQW
jgi:RHS repeat-associated protein